jgi:SHOCT-like protein
MSSEERRKILQMVEEGRISPQEAASLMHALDEDADLVQEEVEVFQTESRPGFEGGSAPEFEEVRSRARRFAMIPLWTGVFIAVLSAWGIYSIQQSAGVNFWFFCLMVPLLLGVALIALSAGGEGSKWLYVNVDRRKAHDWPQNITLGFPLPLGLTAWFLRNFGHNIRGMGKTNVDEIIQVLDATGKSGAPFIVNVHDDEDGEHVQVYIG